MLKSNTCLAVLKDKKGHLWFAADKRQSNGMSWAQKSPRPKVTLRNGVLFAGTGTSSICDLVTDQINVPDLVQDSYQYMHGIFMPALFKFLHENHYIGEKSIKLNTSGSHKASILVGVNSELYCVNLNSDLITFDCLNTPYADGCGGNYALGSLLTTEGMKGMDEKKRLTKALEIASKISPGCGHGIDIIHN